MLFEDKPPSNDSIVVGFLLAFACQLLTIVITILLTQMMVSLRSNFPAPILIWGLLQWIVLLPVYLLCRSRAHPLQAKGILIAGFLGMLLNAACYGLLTYTFSSR